MVRISLSRSRPRIGSKLKRPLPPQSVVAVARDVLAPSGQLRYAPDSTFVMLSCTSMPSLHMETSSCSQYFTCSFSFRCRRNPLVAQGTIIVFFSHSIDHVFDTYVFPLRHSSSDPNLLPTKTRRLGSSSWLSKPSKSSKTLPSPLPTRQPSTPASSDPSFPQARQNPLQ
jgi:hypothetical protein